MKNKLGYLFVILFWIIALSAFSQDDNKFKKNIKKTFKFATFYGGINGNNSISDVDVYSVTNGLETTTIKTPFDYSITAGIRKIARFGYENRANTFYDGSEKSYSDAATLGKVKGFEFLFELDYARQQGTDFFNQQHFLRYVANRWIAKMEYVQDGFADIKYYESSQRYRLKLGNKFSFNLGAVQRLSEPYGYDPLEEWLLETGDIHYTNLALEEGYNVEFDGSGGVTYLDPNGAIAAENTQVWEAVVIPGVLADYTEKKRNELPTQWNHSLVIGFDYYHFTKDFWVHSWANIMPYHYNNGGEFSYHKFNNDDQWNDYSGGLIFGYRFNKHLGCFIEGRYAKYWNREWHDFKIGVNYVIF